MTARKQHPVIRNKTANSGRSFRAATEQLVGQFRERRPIRTGSLLVSIFGDAIAPHGGAVWLGSLIASLEPFGINQRLVRTSVFRLTRDGWLQNEQIGRRSYYSLTMPGRSRFQDASRRIYNEPRQDWSGEWCLVMLAGIEGEFRDEIRKELGWLGFGQFSSNVLVHPSADVADVEERLGSLPAADKVLIMKAVAQERHALLRELVSGAWSLPELDNRYEVFLDQFRPVYKAASGTSTLDPDLAFQVRTLLIHEYRKVLLRDPTLPRELLPERWSGVAAYQLCRNIYSLVAAATEDYLTGHMETADGPLPPADSGFYQRFGGLDNT